MISDGKIKLGMSISEFQSKMYWGAAVEDDPWQEGHGGSGFYPGYEGFYFVSGGRREVIFVFNPDKILVAVAKTSAEAKTKVDTFIYGETLKTANQQLDQQSSLTPYSQRPLENFSTEKVC